MTVAIGSILLLVASVLLCAVIVLAIFGLAVWLMRDQRYLQEGAEELRWETDPTQMPGPDGTSAVAEGK
jgi:hypothetical protein